MPINMRRKVRENVGFLPFVKNDFKAKVANETTHNVGIADQKNMSDMIFDPFCNQKRYFTFSAFFLIKWS